MSASRDVVVEIPHLRELPFFPPGVRVALSCAEDASNNSAPPPRRREILLRRGSRRRSGAASGATQSRAGRRSIREPFRIRARVVRGKRPGIPSAVVTCRLTAFVCAPDVIHARARAVTRSELRAFQRELQHSTATSEIPRSLQLYVLLRLQRSRHVSEADRRHPALTSVWNAFVRAEHRRMLNRLRHAVRRLEVRRKRLDVRGRNG
jgi:hypothetical protein